MARCAGVERVDVDHAHHVVAALHRHADRLANAQLHNAGGGVPALVLAGVAGEHALVVLHHVVEDGLADGQLIVVWWLCRDCAAPWA